MHTHWENDARCSTYNAMKHEDSWKLNVIKGLYDHDNTGEMVRKDIRRKEGQVREETLYSKNCFMENKNNNEC